MKISVFGLGYVGCVTGACLAKEGHEVVGVDVSEHKVNLVNDRKSPIVEKDFDPLLAEQVVSGRLRATTSAAEAVKATDCSLICVGTPSDEIRGIDLSYMRRVCKEIGTALAEKSGYHVVVPRSTMMPGSTEEMLLPILAKASGRSLGNGLGICYNPEFLREGQAIFDFYNPPLIVIGASDEQAGGVVREAYGSVNAPVSLTTVRAAEMLKYVNNTFHGLKVSFANEIGNLCKNMGIDSHEVMRLFCLDTKLNLSPYYLKPGFAFGGSCLTKDLRALLHQGHKEGLRTPVLESILQSNETQIQRAVDFVRATGKRKIGVFGLSFKAGTDDLRESPAVELVERLLGKGYEISIYDKSVSLARLFGANKAYIEKVIPHISKLMRDEMSEVLESSEVLVLCNRAQEFKEIPERMRKNQTLVDLVRIDNCEKAKGKYIGLCW